MKDKKVSFDIFKITSYPWKVKCSIINCILSFSFFSVFILICAVILLTSAQFARSSPLEIIENNEVPVEGESENLTDSQDGEIIQNEPIVDESNSVNEDDDGELDDDDDVEYIEEEDPEMIERTTGIEIQICAENPNIIYPLQTR